MYSEAIHALIELAESIESAENREKAEKTHALSRDDSRAKNPISRSIRVHNTVLNFDWHLADAHDSRLAQG